mmetsp:Transcript_103974/g.298867  ORF Transcript_103974/g.298867 Transcript_103974/m.298867 type:complete len:220 (+) Transcript_103974:1411-2070(+)
MEDFWVHEPGCAPGTSRRRSTRVARAAGEVHRALFRGRGVGEVEELAVPELEGRLGCSSSLCCPAPVVGAAAPGSRRRRGDAAGRQHRHGGLRCGPLDQHLAGAAAEARRSVDRELGRGRPLRGGLRRPSGAARDGDRGLRADAPRDAVAVGLTGPHPHRRHWRGSRMVRVPASRGRGAGPLPTRLELLLGGLGAEHGEPLRRLGSARWCAAHLHGASG